MKVAIVIGVGPDRGLGAQLASRFAAFGLHVFIAGRTQEKLDDVAANIATNGGAATAVVTDAFGGTGKSHIARAQEGAFVAVTKGGHLFNLSDRLMSKGCQWCFSVDQQFCR